MTKLRLVLKAAIVLPFYLFIALMGAFVAVLVGASVFLSWLVGIPLTITRGDSKVRYRWFTQIK